METRARPTGNQSVVRGVREQLQQFQEKVQICSESFAVHELVDTLQAISQKTHKVIQSRYNLQAFVDRIEGDKENADGAIMEKEVMYARWFLDNMGYLRDLNKQFTEKIYTPLTQLFNGENAITQRSTPAWTKPSWSILLYQKKIPEITELYNDVDMENVFIRLRYVKSRVDHLLEDEGEIDPALFSLASQKVLEGKNLPNHSFIRLMPDVQHKLTTAGSLAERWLEIITSQDVNGRTMISKLERVKTMLGNQLDSLNHEIKTTANKLSSESDDLQDLLAHEDRATLISNKCQSLELRLSTLKKKISQNTHQIEDIEELLETSPANKQFVANLLSDLHKKRKFHDDLTRQTKIVQFELSIVREDLCVELELKPSVIRITNSVQENCEQLETSLEDKKVEKYQLEMALKPVIPP
ncbi:myosin-13-like [Watersipora subatra]|uniref:myosin-13-like n=1 Tax=Watersipora subatra TaxID=2589382 RepID=UPI00355C45B6